MRPAPAECGVDLVVETVSAPLMAESTGYVIAISGATVEVYPLDPEEPGAAQSKDPWTDGLVLLVPADATPIERLIS